MFVLLTFFNFNCEKENPQEENVQIENQESTFTLKHYSKNDIEKNTKLVTRLKEFNDDLIENKSTKQLGKNVYNKEYDFTIYTDSATYIQEGDYHSYTFPLVQDDDEKITNVFFELNDQGEYDAYLVNYDYSANDLKYKEFNSLSMKTSLKPINLDFNSLFARTNQAYVCVFTYEEKCTSGWVKGRPDLGGGNLGGTETRCEMTLLAEYCENVLYYDEDYKKYQQGNTATVTIGGTTYGGTGGSRTSPMPSPFSTEELMQIDIVKNRLNLNHPERLWIDKWENAGYAFKIYPFLKFNIFSDEAIEFGNKSVDTWMINRDAEVDFDDQIINELTGKAKCLNALLTDNGTDYVKNLLKNFQGESVFDIKIVSKDIVISTKTGNEINGNTTPPVNNLITINISTEKANEHSALDAARTILHEYIHADIFRKLDTKYNANLELDFKKTYESYEDQHEIMGEIYVTSMRDALKHFHKNVLTDDYNKYLAYYEEEPSDAFYEALAWRGLAIHNVKAWTGLSPERQIELNNLSSRVDVLTKNVTCTE